MVELPVEAAAGPAVGERHPARGYLMVIAAATLWGVNGAVTKVILASGISTERVAELRSTGAALAFGCAVAVTRPSALRARPRELAFLAFFGIVGLSLVQWLYFVALHRLQIGVALLLEYLAPLGIALWARFVFHEHVRRRIWLALALALAGLALVVEIWRGFVLDGLGVGAALGSATAYVTYVLSAEHGLRSRDTLSLTFYGFLFSALFWTIVQSWWSFPGAQVAATVSLHGRLAGVHLPVWALLAWLVVLGTMVPFRLLIGALPHVGATRAGLVATLEPVVAAAIAFAWLRESLGAAQLTGGAVVLAAIGLAQSAR
jgi:drug/metabolite transporter (DMT)-like permease